MSQGIEIKTRKHVLRGFRNTFLGTDAVEWLIADPRSGVNDLDGAIQVGQRLIEHGYITRVSRELKAQQMRHFAYSERTKSEFRGGDSLYRFDTLRISPFQLHVVVRRARGLKSMDLNGKNDPYVKLRLGTQTAETRVVMKTNDPVWDETFVFGVHSVDAQQLQLSVCDYDKFKRDDHIGSCLVGLSHLPCSEGAPDQETHDHHHHHHQDSATGGGGGGEGEEPATPSAAARAESVASFTSARSVAVSEAGGRGLPGHRQRRSGRHRSGAISDVGGAEEAAGLDLRGTASVSGSGSGSKSLLGSSSVKGALSWVKKRGSFTSKSSSAPSLEERGDWSEERLTYYRLLATNEKRLLKEDAQLTSQAESKKPSCGELACDIRLTSFQPKPLPVQGEAKFILRCRIWDMYGVTSSEERNLMEINSAVVKHKAVLMLCRDRVSSTSFERGKDKEKKTSFKGSLISLDTRCNMATEMVKVVVHQKVSPVEIAYKPVATVSIPLRSIPVVFPGDRGAEKEKKSAQAGHDPDSGEAEPEAGRSGAPGAPQQGGDGGAGGGDSKKSSPRRGVQLCGGPGGAQKRRVSLHCSRGKGGGSEGSRAPHSGDALSGEGGAQQQPAVTARRYRLNTLAGPLTNRTMDNGFVVMSLTLVAGGNDLLGEPDELDREDVKVPPPPPPDPLTDGILDVSLKCGYQRLRKALLWNDSKLQAALGDVLNRSELEQSEWVDRDGEAAAQDNLTGCTRERSFMLPKSSLVAATRAECHDVVLADGPSLMAYETRSRTPAVSFGDKFLVVNQFVLTKEGPDQCRLQTSSSTVFSDKVMAFVHNQIVSAVARVSKENHNQLVGLIEDAISGKGGGGKGSKTARNNSRESVWYWSLAVLVLGVVALLLVLHRASIDINSVGAEAGVPW
eukprot:g9341.t1